MTCGTFGLFSAARNKFKNVIFFLNVTTEQPKIHQYLHIYIQHDGEGGDDCLVPFSIAGIGI